MDANGSQTVLQIGIASEQLSWVSTLQRNLPDYKEHLTFTTLDSQESIIPDNNISALIVVASPKAFDWLSTLPQTRNDYPIILLIPDDANTPDAHVLSLVDGAIPAMPPFLEQLPDMLQLHLENKKLQKRVKELEEDIANQRKITNEIEILKNAIVRNVSHELRTPLLQVKSAVSLIGDEVPEPKLIVFAENAVARLETHVKNITMLGQSLDDMNLNPIILRDAVEYAKRNIGRIWQHKNSVEQIHLDIEKGLPPILADKQGLSTVLQLLIDNSLKFTDKQEKAKITIIGKQHSDTEIYIAIQDNGIGIAEEEVKKIFASFYQVDSSSTRRYGGAGVGLALVTLILERHNTSIQVKSKEGEGSTFSFYLPSVNLDDYEDGKLNFG